MNSSMTRVTALTWLVAGLGVFSALAILGPAYLLLARCVWEGIFLSSLMRVLRVLACQLSIHALVDRLWRDLATVSEKSAFIEIPLALLHTFLPITCVLALALDLLRMRLGSAFQLLQTLDVLTFRVDVFSNSRCLRPLGCERGLHWHRRR